MQPAQLKETRLVSKVGSINVSYRPRHVLVRAGRTWRSAGGVDTHTWWPPRLLAIRTIIVVFMPGYKSVGRRSVNSISFFCNGMCFEGQFRTSIFRMLRHEFRAAFKDRAVTCPCSCLRRACCHRHDASKLLVYLGPVTHAATMSIDDEDDDEGTGAHHPLSSPRSH